MSGHPGATFGSVDDRGCEYCRDDQNMHYGHVEQVASNEDMGVLLRCPQCGWLYLDPSDGLSEPRHIDAANAASWFGFST
jgi:hypothetical protein